MIAYMATPRSEVSTFPRFYLNRLNLDTLHISMRLFSLHPLFSACHNADEAHGQEACYVRRWLFGRLLVPLNCTPFYMSYRAPQRAVCETGRIVRNYLMVNDLALNETKVSLKSG